jgi:apolipoprotein N-acyltransferase
VEGNVIVPLFAMPPPEVILFWPIGFLLVLLIAGLFVTATRTRGKRGEQDRRAGLGCMAIFCGPLVGAALAWLGNTLGNVHPADVKYTYTVLTFIGGIAGLFAGIAFGITGLLCRRDSSGKAVPAKPVDVTDEL